MQHPQRGVIIGVAGVLLLSALAAGQDKTPHSPWKYYPEDRAVGDGGPAPKRTEKDTPKTRMETGTRTPLRTCWWPSSEPACRITA